MTERLKIIVAEDNFVQLTFMTHLIDKLGYDALPAENGTEALELVRKTGAQIVISDYQMPNLNGIELTQEIRRLDVDHYVYIIMLTGNEEDDIRDVALDAGVDDFLTKNRSPAILKARIRAATRQINHAAELAERTQILKESNDRIQDDLRAAAAAQRQLLPDIHEDMLGFRIASAFVPSSIVSGDMFGCFPLSDNLLGFYAVDVSGHGVRASLLSVAIGYMITPEYFKKIALPDAGTIDPAALVTNLNDRFSTADNDDYFTMFCGVIDTSNGRLHYCQAASPSPYYLDKQGKAVAIGDGGFPVGMLPGLAYENNIFKIDHGGMLVLSSDAASEAENDQNELFGLNRLSDLLEQFHDAGAKNIPDLIVHALTDWRCGSTLEDDLTIVTLERAFPNDTHNIA